MPSSSRRCLKALRPDELAQHDLVGAPAHVLGTHDLVGVARLEHAVLVDAAGVREGVGADHRLVRLHDEAGGLADHARGRHDLRRVDADVELEVVAARAHRHHHLFERAVAGTFAQAVDRALDLARAADHHAGQRVGHRHAQVVVAVHRPDRLVAVGDALAQVADEVAEQLGHRVADGVGDVDRGRTFVDHGLEHAAQEVGVGAVAVLGRELDVVAQVAREAHRQLRLLEHLLGRHAQLLLHVQRAGGDEGVDARARRALQRLGGARDVAVVGARQRADHVTP